MGQGQDYVQIRFKERLRQKPSEMMELYPKNGVPSVYIWMCTAVLTYSFILRPPRSRQLDSGEPPPLAWDPMLLCKGTAAQQRVSGGPAAKELR